MKRLIIFCALVSFAVTSSQAQQVHLGIKGGLNIYNMHLDNGVQYDAITGLHAGLLGHIHLSRTFAVQPELLYSRQGAKHTITGNVLVHYKLDYVNLPVMFQYMFQNGFRLEAGPQVGFLMKARQQSNGSETDVKDSFFKTDFSLGFGLGYIQPKTGFGFDVRYNAGLSDINRSSSVKSTNMGLQAGIFYQFDHK